MRHKAQPSSLSGRYPLDLPPSRRWVWLGEPHCSADGDTAGIARSILLAIAICLALVGCVDGLDSANSDGVEKADDSDPFRGWNFTVMVDSAESATFFSLKGLDAALDGPDTAKLTFTQGNGLSPTFVDWVKGSNPDENEGQLARDFLLTHVDARGNETRYLVLGARVRSYTFAERTKGDAVKLEEVVIVTEWFEEA